MRALLESAGIFLKNEQLEQLETYREMLLDWNTRMDLTSVREDDVAVRHFLDSLLPLGTGKLVPASGTLIDVGTGAGFPGLPLAVALPALQVTLLDAQEKRCAFLRAVTERLALKNVRVIHGRAEEAARDSALREGFDAATARAVAGMRVRISAALCEGRGQRPLLEGAGGRAGIDRGGKRHPSAGRRRNENLADELRRGAARGGAGEKKLRHSGEISAQKRHTRQASAVKRHQTRVSRSKRAKNRRNFLPPSGRKFFILRETGKKAEPSVRRVKHGEKGGAPMDGSCQEQPLPGRKSYMIPIARIAPLPAWRTPEEDLKALLG